MTHGPVTCTALAVSQPSTRQMSEAVKGRLPTNAGVSSADATWNGGELSQLRSAHMLTQNYKQIYDVLNH